MERKLIYLDDAVKTIESFYRVDSDILRKMTFELKDLPSVQPEIIRCKDCKWHLTYHDEKYNVGYELCSNPIMMSGDSMIDMSNNDFCSKAERKGNG